MKVAVERVFVFSEGAAPDPCSRQRSHTGGGVGKVTVEMQQVTDHWFLSLTRHFQSAAFILCHRNLTVCI